MSDFVTDISSEIFNRHWTYLETEESIEKLEERRKLEGLLKEYLCVSQHDKKYFLPETEIVLKNSIRELQDFSVQKAITAFESISQYANNLFTKPWRKEFRVIKVYCGFYQHEITSNLLNAKKLFEAMGYSRLSNDTLVLDGPICPDQVSTVSLDAMAAYVELQIIRRIFMGLEAIGIYCPLLDIYRYREKHTGGTSNAIVELANVIEEKSYRNREKALALDNYGYIDVQPSANYSTSSTHFPPAQCPCNEYVQQLPSAPTMHHRHRPIASSNGMWCSYDQQQQQKQHPAGNLMHSNIYPAQLNYHHQNYPDIPAETGVGGHLPHMSHSRSLEHYSEPVNQHQPNMVPHRHSFDHQQQGCTSQYQPQNYYHHIKQPPQHLYESSYEFIDGNSLPGDSSSISYAAVAANATAGGGPVNSNMNSNSTYSHPYNVSGNRFPLPFKISKHLSNFDNMNSYQSEAPQEPTYAHVGDNHMYASVSKLPQNEKISYNVDGGGAYNHLKQMPAPAFQNSSKDSLKKQQQRNYQTEQLIDFENPILPTPHQQQQFDPIYQAQYQQPNHINDKRNGMTNMMMAASQHPTYPTWQPHFGTSKPPALNNDDLRATATPMENRKHMQNTIDKGCTRKASYTSAERGGDTTDLSYESANDDIMNLPAQQNERNHQQSPTQFTKNQDGVGTFKDWDYVYHNLDVTGNSKDLGGRGDLLIQSLDLDSLNINNDTSTTSQTSSAEKRRSNYAGNDVRIATTQQTSQAQVKRKPRTFDRSTSSTKSNTQMELEASASSSAALAKTTNGKQKTPMDNNKKMKSTVKQSNATTKTTTNKNPTFNKNPAKTNDNKSLPKTMNNNNNNSNSNGGNNNNNNNNSQINTGKAAVTQRKKSPSTGQNPNKYSETPIPPPTSTQIIVTSPNEWSCQFCTFLNPNTKRICEMCCKTIDFDANATSNKTAINNPSPAAGSSSLAHNTPTCV